MKKEEKQESFMCGYSLWEVDWKVLTGGKRHFTVIVHPFSKSNQIKTNKQK